MTDRLFDRLSGALAGRYTLERELGHGGMATVYLATDVKLVRQVAIKVLAPQTREYLGSDRFQREVQLAAQLSHPHIVPVFEAGEAGGVLFYAMGYVEGESLKDRLEREGPLPLAEAVRLVAEIGEALQYAHERGIIHRDIKPANILLSRGHALVADFGIAKAISTDSSEQSLTGTGITVGTVEYMSPEQASGEKRLDGRSDVYALGVLLYELLVGEPPFTGPTVQAVVARIITDPPRRLRTVRAAVPEHVEQAVLSALSKIPADRPPTAQAFVEQLLNPSPVQGRRTGPWLVVPGVVALVAVAGFLLLRDRDQAPPAPARPLGMVVVPSGDYLVGGGTSRPRQTVGMDSFYIDSTEVTIAAYQRYLDSTRGTAPWRGSPPPDWPATGILWTEAQRFCEWREARLPTEDEWEAAARGPAGWRYPWGDSWDRGRANAGSTADTLKPVGGFPLGRSVVGAVDLVGNAWEWVSAEQTSPGGEVWHVIKGGAFNTPPENAAASARGALPDNRRFWYTGFRCARAAARTP